MQGYLYVENESAPKLKYQSRYFILFPFCGLRWFNEEPEEKSGSKLLSSGEDGGWVFGGDIRITSVEMEPPDVIYSEIFPFSLSMVSPTQSYHIRLATDDIDMRILWTDQIKKAIYIQNYLHSCVQCSATPSKAIFCAALAGHDIVNIENIQLNIPSLGSLVMICKFNYNLGSGLKDIHIENAQLTDDHAPLLSSLFSFTSNLESISLSNNYITCQGISSMIESIQKCNKVTHFDLSSNLIADAGVSTLSQFFRAAKDLHHLNLSRNRLGKAAAKHLALYLVAHDSHLTYFNVSYNSMGDTLAQLTRLFLVQNKRMETINISFCQIGNTGLSEIFDSIADCNTLKHLNIAGNFASESTFPLLLAAISDHQQKYGIGAPRNGTGSNNILRREALFHASSNVEIQLGGIYMTSKVPKCLAFSTMRHMLSYASEATSCSQALLRRRMGTIFNERNERERTTVNEHKRHMDIKAPKVNVIICLRIQLMPYMNSLYEFVDSLAHAVQADARQLKVISASPFDQDGCSFVILSPSDASSYWQSLYNKKTIQKLCLDKPTTSKASSDVIQSTVSLPSAERIAIALQQLSHNSSPKLRVLGVRSVYIQRRDRFTNDLVGNSFSCHIKCGGSGGNGVVEHFMPPLFPYADALSEMRASKEDPYLDDEKVTKISLDSNELLKKQKTRESFEPDFFFQEDDDEEDEAGGAVLAKSDLETLEVSEGNGMGTQQLATDLDGQHSESGTSLLYSSNDFGSSHKEKTDRDTLLGIIARLKSRGEVSADFAHFWGAAFGDPSNEEHQHTVKAGLLTSVNSDGVFRSVGKRQELNAAMFDRDKDALTSCINSLKLEKLDGGETIELAERLLGEITMLKHDAGSLDGLAQGPEDIGIVEEFLVNCGRIGYTGPEILIAIELREYLVQWAMELDDTFEAVHLDGLKQRAIVTNLMISRNFEKLKEKILEFRDKISEEIYEEASTLLTNYSAVQESIQRAKEKEDRDRLEAVLAEAAYYNIYDESVEEAIRLVNKYSSDVSSYFSALMNALEGGDRDDLDQSLKSLDEIGWNHSLTDRESIVKIFDNRNQLINEARAMRRLEDFSEKLKQNDATIKTIEIMQCLREVKDLGLAQLPEASAHVALLENQVKKAAKLASQEDEILQLIDSKNIDKLAEVMSGAGNGTLVMCASSESEMNEWIKVMEHVCQLGSPKKLLDPTPEESAELSSVYMCGTLEKAARGKEGIFKNWRQRFFMLEGLSISYFTKEGGERKGCVRVGGGRVRRMDQSEDLGGRRHCFELREGRDLSSIDPDLIKEAHRQIKQHETDQYNDQLSQAISSVSAERCSALLKEAAAKELDLDFDTVAQAKMLLLRFQQIEIKKELRTVCRFIPRGQIQEAVKKSSTFRLDEQLWMCHTAKLLTERPESELAILRSRGWLSMHDESAFKRSLASIQRFDIKRLGDQEKKLLTAVLLQHAGMCMSHMVTVEGLPPGHCISTISEALDGVMHYFVETEPMQLARLVIKATPSEPERGISRLHSKPFLQKASSNSHVADKAVNFFRNRYDLSLEKYGGLRQPGTHASSFLKNRKSTTSMLGRKSFVKSSETDSNNGSSVLCHSTEPLSHPLLKMNKSLEKEAVEQFKAIQIVLQDRSLQDMSRSRSSLFADIVQGNNDSAVLGSRVINTAISKPPLRDEVYIQLFKQINGNPRISGLISAWTMVSLCLHCFPPSLDFLPYVKNFVAQCVQKPLSCLSNEVGSGRVDSASNAKSHAPRLTIGARLSFMGGTASKQGHHAETASTNNMEEGEEEEILSNIVHYSNKVLQWINESGNIVSSSESTLSMIDEQLMKAALNRTEMRLRIGVMSGSVYDLRFCYGDISSLFSVLLMLFQKIAGDMYSNVETLKSMPHSKSPSPGVSTGISATPLSKGSSDKRTPTTRVSVLERSSSTFFGDRKSASGFNQPDVVAKCFRGFALYDGDAEHRFQDAKTVPVQPPHSRSLPWSSDITWDTLQKCLNSPRELSLRRKHLLVSENLIDSQLDLFGDEVSEKDTAGLRRLWVHWLTDRCMDLPVDHMRIDLLFAEESRYVNSQLYGISDDAMAYLLAMQMTLSWGVEDERMPIGSSGAFTDLKWGSGHCEVMKNIDASVRPSTLSSSSNQASIAQKRAAARTHSNKSKRGSKSMLDRLSWDKKKVESKVLDEEFEHKSDDDGDDLSGYRNWSGPAIEIHALDDDDFEALTSKMITLGFSENNITTDLLEAVVYFMSQFQALAMQIDVSNQNQRFRYMMKSAYLSYVMSWPLAGGSFAMTSCDVTGTFEKTLLCVSGNGVFLLTTTDWNLIFHAPLFDIDSYQVSSTDIDVDVAAASGSKLLTIVVNDFHIRLITTSVDDIVELLDGLCLEVLSQGAYRNGLEGGNDILSRNEEFVPSTDIAEVTRRYQRLFSFLPSAPPPLPIVKSRCFVEAPKSRRAILAEERAEEERFELEQARLAAAAAADRNKAHIEKGRQALSTMMEDDDEDEDDEDQENKKPDGKRVKKARRRVSLLGNGRKLVNPIQMRMEMVENAACGVSSRPSMCPEVDVPANPDRSIGMTSMLESGLDLSVQPPYLRDRPAHDTSLPFRGRIIHEPKLLFSEALKLKNISFPLAPRWGFDKTLSSGPYDWLDAMQVSEEDASVASLELGSDRLNKDRDVASVDDDKSLQSHEFFEESKTHELDHSKKPASVDEEQSFYSHELSGAVNRPASVDEDKSFYSHELSGSVNRPASVDESKSFYSDELSGVKKPASVDEDKSFYSHELSALDTPASIDEDKSFYSDELSNVKKPASVDEDQSFYSHELSTVNKPTSIDEDQSFYSDDLSQCD